MRILHVLSHLNTGGITRYVLSLSARLAQRGHRVIVASDSGDAAGQLPALGVERWDLPLHTSAEISPQVVRSMGRLAARLSREPVDLLHAHTRVGQVVAAWASRRTGIPYLTTWHGMFRRRLGRRLWPCTGQVTIAISEPVRQHLIEDFAVPSERIRLIYNGIDTAYYAVRPAAQALHAFRAQWGLTEHDVVVGGIGRLASGRVKGFDTLLVAAYLLQRTLPSLRVLIVGDGPRRPFLEDIVRRLRLQQRVRFVGALPDVRVALAAMNVFVFPSRWPEAFGLTLVEAMAAGRPVVATKVGAVPEIIQHGRDGWLISSDDPRELAESLALLVYDPLTAQCLGEQGQRRVREAFNLERMTDEVEALYREVVCAAPHA